MMIRMSIKFVLVESEDSLRWNLAGVIYAVASRLAVR